MSRTPTPREEQLAWWHDALNGFGKIVAAINKPQCGFYRRKLVHGGPFVPARIWLEQEVDEDTGELLSDEVMRCEVDGLPADPVAQWPSLWNGAISEEQFNYMLAMSRWAVFHAPGDPAANPHKPLNHLSTPIRF